MEVEVDVGGKVAVRRDEEWSDQPLLSSFG